MLSIGKLGAQQIAYYQQSVAQGQDDYYSGRGEAPGQWAGRGAEALGLSGQVDGELFGALMAGIDPSDPDGQRTLRDSDGQLEIVAYDLTFSAPKSVSVEFATQDAATRDQLVAAHEAAVAAALGYVEDAAVQVRRGHASENVQRAGGLVAGAYRHRMSRALDPQLHTHVVAANVAQGEDGRWTALHGRALYTHAKTAGYLYQAHLRAEVRERLGWQWGQVANGMAELEHSDPAVLEHFSQRSQQVKQAAAATGQSLDSWGRRNHWALATRDRKNYGVEKDSHSWRQEVLARAAEHGHDEAVMSAAVDAGRDRLRTGLTDAQTPAELHALGDRLAGPGGLTQKANTFAERDALREYAAAAGQGARVPTIRDRASGFAARGDVLETTAGASTTADLAAAERRLISAALSRAGEGVAVVDNGVLEHALTAADRPLTGQQDAAVRGVATSGNGVDVIEALAGTGKTFTAGTIRHVYQHAGYDVVGLGPTGKAVRELAEEAGIASSTLDSALSRFERYDQTFAPRTVVILDEASMASTRQSERILERARAAGVKVIAIGDSGQLPSVQAGGWLRDVGDHVGRLALTEVMRQRDRNESKALGGLHDGRPAAYLQWADAQQRIVVHTDSHAQAGALADWQQAVAEHGPASAVLIARTQDARAALNQLARAHWREAGNLDVDVQYGSLTVAVGDRVICRRNDYDVDVDNGTRGSVRATATVSVIIETDAGTIRELPASYVSEHLEHAYCLTGHGMQGGTVEHATVLAEVRDLTKGWSYTALSRARGITRLHVDTQAVAASERDREEHAPVAIRQTADRAEVLERTAAQMLVRDDEDLAVSQLPAQAAAGRPDDPELDQAPVLAAGELGELGAERLNTQTPPPASAAALAQLQAERDRLIAQRASMTLRPLRELDGLNAQRAQLLDQNADTAARLATIDRVGDPASHQRVAALAAAGAQQLAALDMQTARLQREVGPADQIREEDSGLQQRIATVQAQARQMRDTLADQIVAAPPAWAHELLGERPEQYQRGGQWDHGLREIARYRVEHQVPDTVAGLGEQPADGQALEHWQQASRVLEQTQRRFGVNTDRLATVTSTQAGEHDRSPSADRHDLQIADPLDQLRDTLGDQLADRLPDRRGQGDITQRSREELEATVAEQQAAIDRFPGRQALELGRLARDRQLADERRESATREVAQLQGERDGLGRFARSDRARLDVAIQTRQRAVDAASKDVERLDARHEALIAGGHDPAEWIQRDGDAAAEWGQARHELDVRRELELREAADRASQQTPDHVRETLGERPGPSVQRDGYDQLAGDLERYRLEHEIDVDRDGVLGVPPPGADPARDQLAARVRDSRLERGLSPTPAEHDLDIEISDTGIDI